MEAACTELHAIHTRLPGALAHLHKLTDNHTCMHTQADLEAQGSRSQRSSVHVLLLPTVVINTNQYRGRLDVPSVTRALCAGFDEATEPDVCLSGSLQEDDCATSNHGCWKDASGKWDACLDTFRGRTCRCPPGETSI